MHHDWHIAAEHAQGTVRALSRQLRQFLDDQAWLENRRILDLIRQVEQHALDMRADAPRGEFFNIEGLSPAVSLPLERPLYTPGLRSLVDSHLNEGVSNTEAQGLYNQVVVDREALVQHAYSQLQQHDQVSLGELVEARPMTEGLAELVVWLQIADTEFRSVTDDSVCESIVWQARGDDGSLIRRQAELPRILLLRA